MNDMNESPDIVEQAFASSMKRRDFLTKAAAAGAIAWTAPVILSRPAFAADGGGGTPNCRPTVGISCLSYFCAQGNKFFPGFNATTSSCPCSHTVPPQRPLACIKITNVSQCDGKNIFAYGNGTDCSPLQGHPTVPDVHLSTGNWECFDPTQPVFWGLARSGNGAIPNLASCTFTFRLGIWAGSCPDRDSTDDAFTCQTFDVSITWNSATNTVTNCQITPAAPANSLCTTVPADSPPCCPPVKPGPKGSCCP